MVQKLKNTAADDGRARGDFDCWAASNVPESRAPTVNIQERRARWLTRRHRIAPALAATIAELVFAEARP
jgi:hypothetical protein